MTTVMAQTFSPKGAEISFGCKVQKESRRMFHGRTIAVRLFLLLIAIWGAKPVKSMAAAEEPLPHYYELQEESKVGENFAYASVQCWLPTDGGEVHGILCVVLHPHGENRVRFDKPEPWVALARQNHCALMGVSFVAANHDDDPWCRASHGAGRALLAAIDDLAESSDDSRLRSVPIIIAGICEAGQFAYEFAAFAPTRTSAFLTMGGGKHELGLVEAASVSRALLIAATDRGDEARKNMTALFERGEKNAAPWCLERETIAAYDKGQCSIAATRFLSQELGRLDGVVVGRAGEERKDVDSPVSLSFVSTPLDGLGVASVGSVNLGTVPRSNDAGATASCEFDVIGALGNGADEVRVSPALPGVNCKVLRKEPSVWRVKCELDSTKFPSGPFRVCLPVRFYRAGRLLLGGLTETITGRFIGDIGIEPSTIVVAQSDERRSNYTLRLKSKTDKPFRVLGVESATHGWIRTKVTEQQDISAKIECVFEPPVEIAGQAISGYLTIRIQSEQETMIRILYYGVTPK